MLYDKILVIDKEENKIVFHLVTNEVFICRGYGIHSK